MSKLPMWLIRLGLAGTVLSLAMGLGPLLFGGGLGMVWLYIVLPLSVGHLVMGAVATAASSRGKDEPPGG